MRYKDLDIRLVAIDIDGTLLGPDGHVSPENQRAVEGLQEAGLTVVLASGRSHANMLPFHSQLKLSSPLVSIHGAVVCDLESKRPRGAITLAPNIVEQLTLQGRKAGVAVVHYRDQGVYLEKVNPFTEFDQSRNTQAQIHVQDLLHNPGPVHKVMWLGDPSLLREHSQQARALFEQVSDIYDTDPTSLEFVSPGVSKAVGVGIVAQDLGLESSQVAAFGDGNNDVPMLSWAGLGVAMGHATLAAKAAARCVGPEGPMETALARAISLAFT